MLRLLVHMKRWANRPPSWAYVRMVLIILALAGVIVGLERFGLWPEWANADRVPRPRMWGF